jgi:hypothetical protein
MFNLNLCRSSVRTAVAVAGASLLTMASSSSGNIAHNDAEANPRLSRQPTFNATTTKHSLKMIKRSIATKESMVVISGSAHPVLAKQICSILNVSSWLSMPRDYHQLTIAYHSHHRLTTLTIASLTIA